MAYQRIATNTRPSTSVAWYPLCQEWLTYKKATYTDTGKILSTTSQFYDGSMNETTRENTITSITTTIFDSVDSFNQYESDATRIELQGTPSEAYRLANNITMTVTHGEV